MILPNDNAAPHLVGFPIPPGPVMGSQGTSATFSSAGGRLSTLWENQ